MREQEHERGLAACADNGNNPCIRPDAGVKNRIHELQALKIIFLRIEATLSKNVENLNARDHISGHVVSQLYPDKGIHANRVAYPARTCRK
jgi:hypothetical protein